MKVCGTCKIAKPFKDFGVKKRKDDRVIYQSKCKECNRKYQKEYYRRNKEIYSAKARIWKKEYKRTVYSILMESAKDGCVICGEKDYRCLQFNHIDRKTKTDGIADMVSNNRSLDLIEKEVEKCEVVCANCHFKITSKQFGWYSCIL